MSTTALVFGCLFLATAFAFVAYLLNRRDEMDAEQAVGAIDRGWINDTVGREHEGFGGH